MSGQCLRSRSFFAVLLCFGLFWCLLLASSTAVYVRKEIRELSPMEIDDLIQGFLLLKAEGTYDNYVKAHMDCMFTPTAFDWEEDAIDQCSIEEGECAYRNACHRGPAFLPWHRLLLYSLEHNFRRVLNNTNFAFPYWDWLLDHEQGLEYPYWTKFMGGDGDPSQQNMVTTGPFAYHTGNWDIPLEMDGPFLRRHMGRLVLGDCPGVYFNSTPTQAEVDYTFDTTCYAKMPYNSELYSDGFQNRLEGWIPPFTPVNSKGDLVMNSVSEPYCGNRGPHNQVHLYVGGSMSDSASAPNEPVFFLHHAMVDKLWHDWTELQKQNRGNGDYSNIPIYEPISGGPESHNFFDPLLMNPDLIPDSFPQHPTIADVYDIEKIGYVYSNYKP